EDIGGNLPTLLVTGTVSSATTVTLSESGTATGEDYTLASTTINIPVGVYNNTPLGLGLTITADAVIEPNQTIILDLVGATGDASLAGITSTTYTILNDDSVTVGFSTANSSDDEDIGGNLPTLLVTGTVSSATTVTLSESGTATGEDYTLASTTINIPVGVYNNTPLGLGLTITADAVIEPNQTIILDLVGATGDASLAGITSTTYTILND
ncbi:Calx-beta domain-containing protein, partial [uncultured Eudoraea sp.]|uniref:Calx-beta domain-containing protein n=1 Tax=uncultured Eudoraea sp. TaxID=1035614 RepID=UPI0026067881